VKAWAQVSRTVPPLVGHAHAADNKPLLGGGRCAIIAVLNAAVGLPWALRVRVTFVRASPLVRSAPAFAGMLCDSPIRIGGVGRIGVIIVSCPLHTSMDTAWHSEFRKRMEDFERTKTNGVVPVSIKVRVASGCFHREHSPQAYRLIDEYMASADLSDVHCRFEEHESGPELLVYLAVTTAGLTFVTSVVELITAIIKARSDGIRKGDRPSDPLELIVRGHSKDGEYFEEMILRIPQDHVITARQIEDALAKRKPKTQKKRKKK